MIEIDGSHLSGSGTIVRQSVMYSALTGQPVHVINARFKRLQPGLRRQHMTVIEALRDLTAGETTGVAVNSQEFTFRPGPGRTERAFTWDIGSAGSTTMLALAALPVLALRPIPTTVELRGGLFQDFAPSFFHLQHVVLPLVRRMGVQAEVEMARPGYVPAGEGVLVLHVEPCAEPLAPLDLDTRGETGRLWGIALASRLEQRRVGERMAEAANAALAKEGFRAEIEVVNDESAAQAGAALALFADLAGGARLGADRAGAPRRSSESIGRAAAQQLLEELRSGATLDRFAADQLIAFAALARGESRFRIPEVTDHVETNAWLAARFLDARVDIVDQRMVISGAGLHPRP